MKALDRAPFRAPETLHEHYAEISRLANTITDERRDDPRVLPKNNDIPDFQLLHDWEENELVRADFYVGTQTEIVPYIYIAYEHLVEGRQEGYRISFGDPVAIYDIHGMDVVQYQSAQIATETAARVLASLQRGVNEIAAPHDQTRSDVQHAFGELIMDYAIDEPRDSIKPYESIKAMVKYSYLQEPEKSAQGLAHKIATDSATAVWRLDELSVRERIEQRIDIYTSRQTWLKSQLGKIALLFAGRTT